MYSQKRYSLYSPAKSIKTLHILSRSLFSGEGFSLPCHPSSLPVFLCFLFFSTLPPTFLCFLLPSPRFHPPCFLFHSGIWPRAIRGRVPTLNRWKKKVQNLRHVWYPLFLIYPSNSTPKTKGGKTKPYVWIYRRQGIVFISLKSYPISSCESISLGHS